MNIWQKILNLFRKPPVFKFKIEMMDASIPYDFIIKACSHAENLYNKYDIDVEFTTKGTPIKVYGGRHYDIRFGQISGLSHNYQDDARDFIEVWTCLLDKNASDKNIRLMGEVIAHEIGHILGLGHYADNTNIMTNNWEKPHNTLVTAQLNIIKNTKTS